MAYVERDAGGKVKGVYARRQPGIAEEFLAADDPEIVAFRNPAPPPKPKAPPAPVGGTVAQLRAEVAAMRQALIDAGFFDP